MAESIFIDDIEYRCASNEAPNIFVSKNGQCVRRGTRRVNQGTKTYNRYNYPIAVLINAGTYTTKQGSSAAKAVNIGRLVLDAWCPNPDSKNLQCDHIDRNPFNNTLSNLRWVTKEENMKNRDLSKLVMRLKDRDLINSILKKKMTNSKYCHPFKDMFNVSFAEYIRLTRRTKQRMRTIILRIERKGRTDRDDRSIKRLTSIINQELNQHPNRR